MVALWAAYQCTAVADSMMRPTLSWRSLRLNESTRPHFAPSKNMFVAHRVYVCTG